MASIVGRESCSARARTLHAVGAAILKVLIPRVDLFRSGVGIENIRAVNTALQLIRRLASHESRRQRSWHWAREIQPDALRCFCRKRLLSWARDEIRPPPDARFIQPAMNDGDGYSMAVFSGTVQTIAV